MKSVLKKSLLAGDKRRSRLEIIAAIINAAKKGESKTEIAKISQQNSKHLQLYLDQLIRLKLIETKKVKGERIYVASQKGINYLKQYSRLKSENVEIAQTSAGHKSR